MIDVEGAVDVNGDQSKFFCLGKHARYHRAGYPYLLGNLLLVLTIDVIHFGYICQEVDPILSFLFVGHSGSRTHNWLGYFTYVKYSIMFLQSQVIRVKLDEIGNVSVSKFKKRGSLISNLIQVI